MAPIMDTHDFHFFTHYSGIMDLISGHMTFTFFVIMWPLWIPLWGLLLSLFLPLWVHYAFHFPAYYFHFLPKFSAHGKTLIRPKSGIVVRVGGLVVYYFHFRLHYGRHIKKIMAHMDSGFSIKMRHLWIPLWPLCARFCSALWVINGKHYGHYGRHSARIYLPLTPLMWVIYA